MYYLYLVPKKDFDTVEISTQPDRKNCGDVSFGRFETREAALTQIEKIFGGVRFRGRFEGWIEVVEVYEVLHREEIEVLQRREIEIEAIELSVAFLLRSRLNSVLSRLNELNKNIKQNTNSTTRSEK
jgi:hypothetical protein